MKTELYFLRSTEQKIVSDMLHYSQRIDVSGKSLADFPALSIYDSFYGFTSKDLGLYALADNQLAGAVWIRRLNIDHASNAYINDDVPVLNIAVLPSFRRNGIGSLMLEQLFLEAGALYDSISTRAVKGETSENFFLSHGFTPVEDSSAISVIDGSETVLMIKNLFKGKVDRPTDGYDPRRWMD
jgi:ribosomal protein S18 acetylase RimI-like enzyme